MNYVLIALLVLVVFYILRGIKIVSQSETMIVERLGKYNRTLNAGINVILPIVEQAKETIVRRQNGAMARTSRIDMREQVYDFDKQSVITKDNVMTEINALLYFQIVDPVKAVYEIQNLPMAIEKLTQTTLRNVVGEMELDETLTSRDTINSKLRTVLDDATNKWGVKVNRVELQDITPPESIRRTMELQMQAERNRRAEILRAEGEAQAKVLQAEAEARAIRQITEAVSNHKGADPVNYLLAVKYVEALKEVAGGQQNKTVYLPYEASNLLGSLAGIKDLFNK